MAVDPITHGRKALISSSTDDEVQKLVLANLGTSVGLRRV